MTDQQRLQQLEKAVATFTAQTDQAIDLIADRLSWAMEQLLDVLPDEEFQELWRRDVLDLFDRAESSNPGIARRARATLDAHGLSIPDTLPPQDVAA